MAKYFSQEYKERLKSPGWFAIRRFAFALTLNRDVLFPFLPAQECDHLVYDRLGRELPFIDIVPLHKWTHFVVTKLRERGMKTPVNIVLRAAYAIWLMGWVYLIMLLGQVGGLWHGVPLPSLDSPHRIALAIGHVFSGLEHTYFALQSGISQKH